MNRWLKVFGHDRNNPAVRRHCAGHRPTGHSAWSIQARPAQPTPDPRWRCGRQRPPRCGTRSDQCAVKYVALIDAEAGNHIWAERYDRALEDVFAVQDEITTAVVTAIQPAVADAELRRALRKAPGNLGAWEAYQRGLLHLGRFTAATDNERAREFFRDSITLDATFASAYAGLSLTYIREVLWSPRASSLLKLAETWARKAVETDANNSEAQAMLAHTTTLAGGREEGRRRALLALEMNPNSAWANYAKGESLLFNGRPSEAREPLMMALRLDPRGPLTSHFMMLLIISYYFERDYANAAEAGLRMVSHYTELPQPYRYLAASLGQLGRSGEAREALDKAMASPEAFQGYVCNRPLWYRSKDYEHMLDGLRKAGWQDERSRAAMSAEDHQAGEQPAAEQHGPGV